jgi:hypothetical protein
MTATDEAKESTDQPVIIHLDYIQRNMRVQPSGMAFYGDILKLPADAIVPIPKLPDTPISVKILSTFVYWCEIGDLAEAKRVAYIYCIDAEDVRMKLADSPDEHFNRQDNSALYGACYNGHTHVARWLTSEFNLSPQDARSNGNLILAQTCDRGHLGTAQWLIETFGLTKRDVVARKNHAFTGACSSGHLAIAQWLHEKFHFTRAEALETRAFPAACQQGHLDCVQWFARTFEITAEYVRADECEALRNSISDNNRTDTARWLIETYNLSVDDIRCENNEVFVEVCGHGQLEFAQWIADRYQLVTADARDQNNYALQVACAAGHLSMVQWLVDRFGLTAEDAREDDKLSDILWSWRSESPAVASQWMIDTFGADILPRGISDHVRMAASVDDLDDYEAGEDE